jgi:hypothetical protein
MVEFSQHDRERVKEIQEIADPIAKLLNEGGPEAVQAAIERGDLKVSLRMLPITPPERVLGPPAFFVTALYYDPDTTKIDRHRCWGFFYDFSQAERAVLEDHSSMLERGYYNTFVIEKVGPGLCVQQEATWYGTFGYDEEICKFDIRKLDAPPESIKNAYGWAIG